ncbi:MAG: GtrA family protein [Bacilli bacterium]|nr:GtrA family protein [Bacilli bacterium]MDD4808805.1 GtrA family protein [Bacilli bacterium]
MNKLAKQIFKFLIVGGLAFLIDYALLYILTEYYGIYYLVSSIISFIISLIFNYIASIMFVFKTNKKEKNKNFIFFIVGSIIGLGINQIVMYVMVEFIHVYYMFSKIVATGVVMVWNFITRKIFIEQKEE